MAFFTSHFSSKEMQNASVRPQPLLAFPRHISSAHLLPAFARRDLLARKASKLSRWIGVAMLKLASQRPFSSSGFLRPTRCSFIRLTFFELYEAFWWVTCAECAELQAEILEAKSISIAHAGDGFAGARQA